MMLPHVDEFRPVHNLSSIEGLIAALSSCRRRIVLAISALQLERGSMLNRDQDILKAAEDWQKAGHGVALATVVETWARRRGRRARVS